MPQIVGTGVLDCPFGVPILPSGEGSSPSVTAYAVPPPPKVEAMPRCKPSRSETSVAKRKCAKHIIADGGIVKRQKFKAIQSLSLLRKGAFDTISLY